MPAQTGSHTPGRRIAGRAQNDRILDPYASAAKTREPATCPDCGAIYHRGRWQWGRPADGAAASRCPACRRVADRFPAGILTLAGPLSEPRKTEIMHLIRHEEAAEKAEHPLNRIIKIDEAEEALVVETTDIHLPQRLGAAVRRAFQGELDTHFDETAYFVRVGWRPQS